MHFFLPVPSDFSLRLTALSDGWRELSPFSYDDIANRLRRVLSLKSGAVLEVDIGQVDDQLIVNAFARLSTSEQSEVQSIIRRCLGLDLDLSEFYRFIQSDPNRKWMAEWGVGRTLVSPTVWEDAVKTLLTTNTTWAVTQKMCDRVCRLGTQLEDDLHAFPTPEQIAAFSPDVLKEKAGVGYRAKSLYQLATAVLNGQIDLESWYLSSVNPEMLYKQIKALHGFGDYAAGTLMRLLRSYGTLSIDTISREVFQAQFNGGVLASDREIATYYARYNGWKGLVLWFDVMKMALPEMEARYEV